MGKRKKIFRWVAGVAGVLLVLLLAVILLSPRLIDLEPIKKRALARISEKVGGEVKFRRFDLSLFPLPHVEIHQASLSLPGKLSGSVRSLKIYPRIRPLLRGKLHLAEVQAESPDFKIRLPKRHKTTKLTTFGVVEETVARLLAHLSSNAPDLIIVLKDGRLDFSQDEQSIFSFRNMYTRMVFPPENITVNLSCASNLSEKIEVAGTLDPEGFKGKGRIKLRNFQPHKLTGYLFPNALHRLGESQVNLTFDYHFVGLKAIQADLEGSLPRLVLQRGNQEVIIKGKNLKGAFRMEGEKIEFILSELSLDYPRFHMKGDFLVDQSSPQIRLELKGSNVDVYSTREAALSLVGDISKIRKVFEIMRGGNVPLITLRAHGNTFADLRRLENFLIKGRILNGKIFVPHIMLDIEDTRGEAIISKGILEGENLEARLGNTWGHEGTLKLGLRGKDAPFRLDILIEADLAELPPIMKRLAENKSFSKEVHLLEDFEGNASGRLILGENRASIKACADVFEINLSARYQRIPYPLEVTEGHLSYYEKAIDITDLNGKLGRSSFSDLALQVEWEREPYLKVESGKADVLLDEIYPWLLSFDALKSALKRAKTLKGPVSLSELELEGPLTTLQKRHFETSGAMKRLRGKNTEERDEKGSTFLWDPPIHGKFRLKSNNFIYAQYPFSPFHADISFSPDSVEVVVTDASVCGISTLGVLKLTPEELSLAFQSVAENQALGPAVNCLRGQQIRVTGNFEFKGKIQATGKADQLVKALQGDIEFVARDGRIYRHIPLEKLFAFLNVTEVFRGQLPEMQKEGFAYKSITAKGNFQNGKLVFEEGIVDGLSMNMAVQGYYDLVDDKISLTVLVAPFKTVDSLVKKIPFLGNILGGALVSVPVHMEGKLEDPTVTPLAPEAVGSRLSGILKRTLQLPLKVIEPVLPKNE